MKIEDVVEQIDFIGVQDKESFLSLISQFKAISGLESVVGGLSFDWTPESIFLPPEEQSFDHEVLPISHPLVLLKYVSISSHSICTR